MGDTACLMHAFSYTCPSAALSNEPKQGNMNANSMKGLLGESVSFGRYTSESLSWEKWSTFSSHNHNNNRYVEEAERYSQPGSVAQKKAFFEEHYKRIAAAKKAAALLEQATAAATEIIPVPDDGAEQSKHLEHGQESDLQSVGAGGDIKEAEKKTPLEIIVKEEDEMQSEKMMTPGLEVISSGTTTPKLEKPQLSSARVHPKKEKSNSTKSFDMHPKKEKSNSTKSFDMIQDDTTTTSAASENTQIEKPLLKNSALNRDAPSVNSKKKSAFSSFKSSIYPKTSKIPSPAKMAPSSRIKKEQKTIPIANNNKSTLQFMEKKQSQKPYNDSTTPARTPERLFAPLNAKTPNNTRVGSAAYRAFQACMSPLRTPNTAASASRMAKNVLATPQPENTRIKTPRDGSKTTTPKWKILSAVCSKSLAANRNKLQSSTVSTPFTLRTEERAARRKQKLEEKFNSKETPKVQLQPKIKTPKVQLQTKIKEKAENELRKLRRSFCFNARPPPNFSKQRETTENHMNKGTTTQAQSSSSKLGKKFNSNGPSIINKSYNKAIYRSSPANTTTTTTTTTSHFLSSSAGTTNHENTSPNIRYY